MAGLDLDPWQRFVLEHALGERPDGKWAAFEVGVEVPRQNGKGGLLEARELAGLFLLEERLIIHSAHEFATAEEALERMAALLEGCPDLWQHVKAVKRSHGQEGIYLKSGQRLRYKTRTKGGGRGFTADCVILDEAMIVPETFRGALMPTLSSRPNPQLWYTGSAVDQDHMDHGLVFASVRARARKGEDPSLAYFGWSPDFERPEDITPGDAQDPEVWAQANPALGIRISVEHVAKEQRSMDARTFAVERLGVGDWPDPDAPVGQVLDPALWAKLKDDASRPLDPVSFAFDVRPDRGGGTIAVAGLRDDDLAHVEVVDRRDGTSWMLDRIVGLVADHAPREVVCDAASPAMSLVAKLEARGIEVRTVNASEHAQACGLFFDAVTDGTLRHLGTDELKSAVRGAAKRQLGDAWAWSRRASHVDISPLVAATLAHWSATLPGRQSVYETEELLIL